MWTFITIAVIIFFVYKMVTKNAKSNHAIMYGSGSVAPKQPTDEELLANARLLMQKAEALTQAEIVGDNTIAGAIKSNTYNGPLPEKRADGGWGIVLSTDAGLFCKRHRSW